MPLEIRELHIRVNVGEGAGGASAGGAAGGHPPAAAPAGAGGAAQPEALLAECVDEVLRILRERKER